MALRLLMDHSLVCQEVASTGWREPPRTSVRSGLLLRRPLLPGAAGFRGAGVLCPLRCLIDETGLGMNGCLLTNFQDRLTRHMIKQDK